jgi:hypothetical protein
MMQRNITILAAAGLAIYLASAEGCAAEGNAIQCVNGADCASGACSAAGQCVTAPVAEGGAPDGNGIGGDGSSNGLDGSGATDGSPSTFDDGEVSGCTANDDGTITQAEVPMQAGLHATYLDAQNATWDTTGAVGDAGTRVWDLTGALTGDEPIIFTTQTPTGAWWASAFSGATYASLLSSSATLLGIFEASDTSLLLDGVVSPASGTTDTELTYATPVVTLQFPLTVGATWSTTSNVTGTAEGIPDTVYTEAYVSKVDEAGTMKTPYGTFSVLRVSTVLTRTLDLVPTTTRSFSFIAECFGPVASVTSQSNETSTEFSSDAEVRRLTP